jgi:hypothetical protein
MTTEEPTNGELSRRMDRLEKAMEVQFTALREEIRAMAYVQPAVYAADMLAYRQRMDRLDADLEEERRERRSAEKLSDTRSWQVRIAMLMAFVGAVLSVASAITTAALK